MPLPVKIIRLLVSDLQSLLEATASSEEGSECSAEGEEREEVREMEALLRSEQGQWEEPEDDPDFYGDPLLQLDLQVGQGGFHSYHPHVLLTQAHLVQYLQEICQLSSFSSMRPHLRPHELVTLSSAGICVN